MMSDAVKSLLSLPLARLGKAIGLDAKQYYVTNILC